MLKSFLRDHQGTIADYNMTIAIDPQDSNLWIQRGTLKIGLGDRNGGCDDLRKAVSLGSKTAKKSLLSYQADWRKTCS